MMKKIKFILGFAIMLFSAAMYAQPNCFSSTQNSAVGLNCFPIPPYPLTVDGNTKPNANAQGWKRGIVMMKQTALYWDGGAPTNRDFFMGHSSLFPVGDFYQGYSTGISPIAPVDYTSKIYITSAPTFMPDGTTQNFKNFLVAETGSSRHIGVNVLDPARAIESFVATAPQLRLTQEPGLLGGSTTLGKYTDFQTSNLGHLNIKPRNGNAERNVGIDVPAPTEKLDVEGNARLRDVPNGVGHYLMTGITPWPTTGPGDVIFRKLAFDLNPDHVLLGNGTWGELPSSSDANNGLSVDGDIIQLGQSCTAIGTPAGLLDNRRIPMENNNLYFTGQGIPTTNAIGLGYDACTPMPAKFNTLQQNAGPIPTATIAGSFINRDQFTSGSSGAMTGIMAISDRTQPAGNFSNVGGDFSATNSQTNIAVNANATYALSSSQNFGVHAVAGNGAFSAAIYGQNAGSYPSHFAGFFNGDVMITGNLWNNATFIFSDKRLKKDIKPLENTTDKLLTLSGYTYNYRSDEFEERNFDNRTHIGLIAQEVEKVFPELITEDADGIYAVDYNGMIPVLLESIKEQQQQIEELKTMIKNAIGDKTNNVTNTSSTVISDAQIIVLEQNIPNPFAEQTSIGYQLKEGVQKAQILFYNSNGKLVNSSELIAIPGAGQLNVFASDLTSGVYTYSLVVDGRIVETKRMVKQ